MTRLLITITVLSVVWVSTWPTMAQFDPVHPPITAANADQLAPLAILGRGWINQIAWSPDGTLAVGSSAGVWLHDIADLAAAPRFLDTQTDTWSVAFSADGRLLAAGGRDRSVRVWEMDAVYRDPAHAVPLHEWRCEVGVSWDPVASLSFGPAGTRLACASDGVIIWDVTSGDTYHIFAPEPDYWGDKYVAFSPDGRTLATTGGYGRTPETFGQTGRVRLWDVTSGDLLAAPPLAEKQRASRYITFSPDGNLLAVIGKNVELRDATTGELNAMLDGTNAARTLMFSPDSQVLFTVGQYFMQWDTTTYEQINQLYLGDGILDAALSPDGAYAAWASYTGQIHIWDITSNQQTATLEGYNFGGMERGGASSDTISIETFAFSPDGTTLAAGTGGYITSGGWVELWDLDQQVIRAYLDGAGSMQGLAYSPDGAQLATASAFSGLRIWDMTRNVVHLNLSDHGDDVNGLAFSADGAYLITGSVHDGIQRWDTATGDLAAARMALEGGYLYALAYSPAGDRIATGYNVGSVIWWDAAPLAQTGQHDDLPGAVRAVAFAASSAPDAVRIAAAGGNQETGFAQQWIIRADGTAEAWGAPIHTPAEVTSIAYSPDGTLLVTGQAFGDVRLWDAATGELRATLAGNASAPWINVAFNAEGTLLATGGWDGTIRLWGVPSPP